MRDTSPIDALKEYLDRWAAAHLSCEPADRRTAEEGVRDAYASAGLAPPQRIVWCGGPLEIAQHLAAASSDDRDRGQREGGDLRPGAQPGRHLRGGLLERGRGRSHAAGEPQSGRRSGRRLQQVQGRERSRQSRRAQRCRRLPFQAQGPSTTRRAQAARGGLASCRVHGFDEVAVGPHDVASLGVYEYLHDVLAWQEPTQPMRGLWKIAKSAGWIVPHEHVCWISERPRILRTDARARLHCADGPALQYRGRLVGLRLERRPGAGVDDRAPRTDHALRPLPTPSSRSCAIA